MKPEWNLCPYDGTRLVKGPEPAREVSEPKLPSEKAEEKPRALPPKAVEEGPKPASVPKGKKEHKPAEGWVIDWDRNLMRAVGRASLDEARGDPERARRLALERAYDSLREGLLDLWGKRPREGVDPYQWAAELVQRAKVAKERQLPDGTWEVEVELKFGKPEEAQEAKEKVSSAPALAQAPTEKEQAETSPRKVGRYTGLIIDARGLGLKPAMSPKIWDENGRLVWQKVKVSPDFVVKEGIVAYARSLEEARKNPRAGKNPLIVKAKGVRGPFKADPVVSPEDADLIIEANKRSKFLDKCKVVFVID
ncbi:MAG TPA: hypothetical protein EYP65_03290 [Armatimonadetes bacterium]|nr:hypothetical protein [Armatimonadota bacterium]